MQLDFVAPHRPQKAQALVQALYDSASARGFDCQWETKEARPQSWVVLYGLGAPDRVHYSGRQQLIAFDAGYWDRHGDVRRFRVSVGGFHCPQRIMRGAQPSKERWKASGLTIGKGGDPRGPILLVGNGPKSNAVGASGWAAAKSIELKTRFPRQRLLYRPKPKKPIEQGVIYDGIANGLIDDVLRGVSLVVCRHSNVAVDACRLGVPVVCDDGAAASIYPAALADRDAQPDLCTRQSFLHRLAWWQWTEQECRDGRFWAWMEKELQ